MYLMSIVFDSDVYQMLYVLYGPKKVTRQRGFLITTLSSFILGVLAHKPDATVYSLTVEIDSPHM